jgi:hypothetical protein
MGGFAEVVCLQQKWKKGGWGTKPIGTSVHRVIGKAKPSLTTDQHR